MRCLLDKGVIRRATEGWIRQAVGEPLLAEQQQAITILTTCPFELCVSAELYHILTHIVKAPFAGRALDQVIVLWPTRYQKRWARRLRRFGFTREDAKFLAYGSFSTDKNREVLGANFVITCDRALRDKYELDFPQIRLQFVAMAENLRLPYSNASLPPVLMLEEFMA
jgi:hypothetical protein